MKPPSKADSIVRDLHAIVPNEPPAEGSAAAERRIAERLIQSLRPVAPLPSRTMLAGGFLAIFAAVTALLLAFGGTRGAGNMSVLQLAGILTAIVSAAGLAAFFLSGEMTPGQRRLVRPGAMTAAILFALFALIFGLFPWTQGALKGWHCFQSGFLYSIPAAILVLWLVRQGAPLAYGAVGAAAGLLSGLAGMTAIHVGCSLLNAPHMAAGHLTIPLAGAAAGYLAGWTLPYLLPGRRRV